MMEDTEDGLASNSGSTLWKAKDYVNFIVKDVARPDLPDQVKRSQTLAKNSHYWICQFVCFVLFRTMSTGVSPPACHGTIFLWLSRARLLET